MSVHQWDLKIRALVPDYESMHMSAQCLLEYSIPESANVLISGVGTGFEAVKYATANPQWSIAGFDPSEQMLDEAVRRVGCEQLQDQVSLKLGTIEAIPHKDKFDAVISILVMHFLPDDGSKHEYLSKINSRLKPQGKVLLVDFVGGKDEPDFHVLYSAWKASQIKNRGNDSEVNDDFDAVEKQIKFVSQRRIEELLKITGFEKVIKFYQNLFVAGYLATKEF